jgi:hypothetical protein
MCFKKPLGLTCKKFNWDRNDRRDAQKESSITQIISFQPSHELLESRRISFSGAAKKHPNFKSISVLMHHSWKVASKKSLK